jgi:hypothetical protein
VSWLCLLLVASTAGCTEPEQPDADALWRDQLVFVGDRGTTLAVSILRRGDGRAELKGWLAREARWQSVHYRQLRIALDAAPDLEASIAALSRASGGGVRISLDRSDADVALSLRSPSSLVRLGARPVTRLGEASDPEGASVYRAGRATLHREGERESGWLLAEETPPERPRHAFVEHGDFMLLFAVVAPGRPIVLRRSVGLGGFDHAFVGGPEPWRTDRVRVDHQGDRLAIRLDELAFAEGRIADRSASAGVAPSGDAVTYEVLLVEGEVCGVAFTIASAGTGTE